MDSLEKTTDAHAGPAGSMGSSLAREPAEIQLNHFATATPMHIEEFDSGHGESEQHSPPLFEYAKKKEAPMNVNRNLNKDLLVVWPTRESALEHHRAKY